MYILTVQMGAVLDRCYGRVAWCPVAARACIFSHCEKSFSPSLRGNKGQPFNQSTKAKKQVAKRDKKFYDKKRRGYWSMSLRLAVLARHLHVQDQNRAPLSVCRKHTHASDSAHAVVSVGTRCCRLLHRREYINQAGQKPRWVHTFCCIPTSIY